jgi:hypothetical protein
MSGKGLVAKTIQDILAREKCLGGGGHDYQCKVVHDLNPSQQGELIINYFETRCTKCGHVFSKLRRFSIR